MAIYFTFGKVWNFAKGRNGMIWRICANAMAIYFTFGKVWNFAKGKNGMIWRLYANAIAINNIKNSPSVQRIEPKGSFD